MLGYHGRSPIRRKLPDVIGILHPKFLWCDCSKSNWPLLFFKSKNGHVRDNPLQAVQLHNLHKIYFSVHVELPLDLSNFVANIRLKTSIIVRRQHNGRRIVSNVRHRCFSDEHAFGVIARRGNSFDFFCQIWQTSYSANVFWMDFWLFIDSFSTPT